MDGQAPGAGGADAVSGRTGDVTPLPAAPVVPALTPRVLLEASAQAAAATLVPRSGTRLTPEQRRAAGRAGVERFAAGRAERYRWYESELARKGRAAP
jgi:hypothetical protein